MIRRHWLKNHSQTVAVLLVLLLAFALRMYGLERYGLWIDEASTLRIAQHTPTEIIEGVRLRIHPPLYYLILHYWLRIGQSIFHVRFLSTLFGMLAIALAYRLANDLLNRQTALVSTLLLTISPPHIWYSQEGRMYSLLVFLCVLIFCMAQRWARNGRPLFLVGYGVAAVFALYTQYVSAFFLIATNLAFGLLFLVGKRYRDLAFWLAVQGGVIFAFLPWLPIWFSQASLDTPWITQPTWAAIRNTMLYLGFGATWNGGVGSYLRLTLVLAAIAAIIPLSTGKLLRRTRSYSALKNLYLLVVHFFVPLLLIIATSLYKSIYQDKQLLILLPLLLMIFGYLICQLEPPMLRQSMAFVLILFALNPLYNLYFVDIKQEWREAGHYITAHWEPHDVIYYNAGVAYAALDPYLETSYPEAGYPILWDLRRGPRYGSPATAQAAEASLHTLADHYERLWLIQYSPDYWDPEGHLVAWLDEQARQEPVPEFYGFEVHLYIFNEE